MQIFFSLMSAPLNSLHRQESQKPSTLDSAKGLASVISLVNLSTRTALESWPYIVYFSQPARLVFTPDVTDVGESIHPMGPYRSREQTPLAYPNTFSQLFWQNSQERDSDVWRVFYWWCSAAASCLCNYYLYSYRALFNKRIQTQKELLLGNTYNNPSKGFHNLLCLCPEAVWNTTCNSKLLRNKSWILFYS